MDRYKLPLRFTILWAVSMAVIAALEMVFGISEKLPFAQQDMESIYCVVGGILAAIEMLIWNYFSERRES